MKLRSVVFGASAVVAVSLLQVNQQVELVKASYVLREKEKQIATLVDRNRRLFYNSICLKSPVALSDALKRRNVELTQPDTRLIAQVLIAGESGKAPAPAVEKNSMLDLLVPSAQAALQNK
ncbi:MAG: hypothetical protein NC924_00750 [Candidatus Omnitrophica bacterium]|nr:hypothetical protein [Candidatus Omnitrophota bacterium]